MVTRPRRSDHSPGSPSPEDRRPSPIALPSVVGAAAATAADALYGDRVSPTEYRRKPATVATGSLPQARDSGNTGNSMMAADVSLLHDLLPAVPSLAAVYRPIGLWDLPPRDRAHFALLVLLYFLQGVPLGLATGSVPFLLKNHMSYGDMGVFSLASYPYSLKLLWSPIVDAVWSPRFGRRKSWILPVQALSGLIMLWLARSADSVDSVTAASSSVWHLTGWWFLLVFTCATQDIAVDGWALTLLSPANVAYASTAQTVGLTAGHFLSYTVFLALHSADVANRFLRPAAAARPEGLVSLSGYLSFWGWTYVLVTVALALFHREDPTPLRPLAASPPPSPSPLFSQFDHLGDADEKYLAPPPLRHHQHHHHQHRRRVSVDLGVDPNGSVRDVYRTMWGILRLPAVQAIIAVHLVAKIGFQANDTVTNLKLLDRGFGSDNIALAVLIDFPFEIVVGYYAGQWSQRHTPIRLWSWAFAGRLVAAIVAQLVVAAFPADGHVGLGYLLLVIAEHVFSTFTSTVMFVAISAFHARISDPAIGGTYMTLLATVSNLGGTFPRYFILLLVDAWTSTTCRPPQSPLVDRLPPFGASCVLQADKHRCEAAGGACVTVSDGYYLVNTLCVLIGAVSFVWFIRPRVLRLQALPLRAWRLAA